MSGFCLVVSAFKLCSDISINFSLGVLKKNGGHGKVIDAVAYVK
jgi:hypothetical protein